MPKPWELDWSAGAPAPYAMPLPIVPSFGRPRAPMLDGGGAGTDAGTMSFMGQYPIAATSSSEMLAAQASPMLPMIPPPPFPGPAPEGSTASGLPAVTPAASPMFGLDPSMVAAGDPSIGLAAANSSSNPTSNRSDQPFQGQPGLTASPPYSRSDIPGIEERAIRPAVLDDWSGTVPQANSSSALGRAISPPRPLLLAAQQARSKRNGPQAGGQSTRGDPPGSGSVGLPRPSEAARIPTQGSNALNDEYAFEANLDRFLKSGSLAPDKKVQLIQTYASKAGRPINGDALKWVMQTAGNGQPIGKFTPGRILSYAQRAAGLRDRLMLSGFSPKAAAALAANAMVESHAYHGTSQESGGVGYGLWQWSPERRAKFEHLMGKSFSGASENDQIRFLSWELQHDPAYKTSWAALSSDQSAGIMASTFALNYERMGDKVDSPRARAAIADVLSTIPFDPTKPPRPPSNPPPEVQAYLRRRARR